MQKKQKPKKYQTTILLEVTVSADSTQQAELQARKARDAIKNAFANDCKIEGVQFHAPRILKTLLVRRAIDRGESAVRTLIEEAARESM